MSGLHGKHHNRHNDAPVIPPRNQHEEIRVEEDLTGVVDGVIPGGYLLTIRLGNGVSVTLQGSVLTSDQPSPIQGDVNVGNSEAHVDLNAMKKTPYFDVDDDFSSDYSYLEISPSQEIQMPDILLYSGKVEPVMLKPINTSRGVPCNQTNSSNKGKGVSVDLNSAPTPEGHIICRNPFLPKNFPSPIVNIRPTYDVIAATSWSSKQGLSFHNQNPKIPSDKIIAELKHKYKNIL